ncbi:MAG: hypothetical protein WCX74_00520 [Candidatus Paceibacterota bacterium]
METGTVKKEKKNYSKIAAIAYLYLLGYFLISNAWFCYFASQKTPNKIVFYIVSVLSIIFAILCFVKASAKKGKKNKAALIINLIIDLLIAVAVVYLAIKIICISNGGPMKLF